MKIEKRSPVPVKDCASTPSVQEGKHIAWVDDDKCVLSAFQKLLEDTGYQYHWFTDGIDFLLEFTSLPPLSGIVLDLGMPGLEGRAVLRALRWRYPQIPALVVSGNHDRMVIAEAMRLGACGYLMKPCRMEQLRSSIAEAFGPPEPDSPIPDPLSLELPRRFADVYGKLQQLLDERKPGWDKVVESLEAFDGCYRRGSLNKGAQDTIVNRQTVTQRIRTLERKLGSALITTRGGAGKRRVTELTDLGTALGEWIKT